MSKPKKWFLSSIQENIVHIPQSTDKLNTQKYILYQVEPPPSFHCCFGKSKVNTWKWEKNTRTHKVVMKCTDIVTNVTINDKKGGGRMAATMKQQLEWNGIYVPLMDNMRWDKGKHIMLLLWRREREREKKWKFSEKMLDVNSSSHIEEEKKHTHTQTSTHSYTQPRECIKQQTTSIN